MDAGWYPTGQDALRWWDGDRWTDHVVYPEPHIEPATWTYRCSVALMAIGTLAFFGTGMMTMGDPGPATRGGVTRQSDVVMVVPMLCPGERLTAITLRTSSGRTLWRSEGIAFDTSSVPLGTAPAGFHDTVEYVPPAAIEPLTLMIDSSEAGRTYVTFSASDVTEGSYLNSDGVFRTRTEFERRSRDDTPCGDPNGDRRQRRIVTIGWLVSAAFLIPGGALMSLDHRRRRRAR